MTDELRKEDERFSKTEVGSLIEAFRSDVSVIAEKVDDLSSRMGRVEERLEGVETKLLGVEDAVRIALPDHERRISRLESKAGL